MVVAYFTERVFNSFVQQRGDDVTTVDMLIAAVHEVLNTTTMRDVGPVEPREIFQLSDRQARDGGGRLGQAFGREIERPSGGQVAIGQKDRTGGIARLTRCCQQAPHMLLDHAQVVVFVTDTPQLNR